MPTCRKQTPRSWQKLNTSNVVLTHIAELVRPKILNVVISQGANPGIVTSMSFGVAALFTSTLFAFGGRIPESVTGASKPDRVLQDER